MGFELPYFERIKIVINKTTVQKEKFQFTVNFYRYMVVFILDGLHESKICICLERFISNSYHEQVFSLFDHHCYSNLPSNSQILYKHAFTYHYYQCHCIHPSIILHIHNSSLLHITCPLRLTKMQVLFSSLSLLAKCLKYMCVRERPRKVPFVEINY